MSSRVQCVNGSCDPSRSGGFCLYCGRSFNFESVPEDILVEALTQARTEPVPDDPDDPNYWVYLMHDIEIIAEPVDIPTNAALAFYGKRTTRKTR